MKVLVTGGTGMVGSYVVPELQRRGADVSVITRNAERVQSQYPGVEPIVGDFLEPFEMRRAMRGFDALFLLVPVVASEANEGLTAVELARQAEIHRIVYMSVHQTAYVPRHVPHIGAKMLIESVIERSGLAYTFIRPNVFMQNDRWYRQALEQGGIYPQPIGDVGVSLYDVRDIAEAIAITLTSDQYAGRSFTIGGPDVLTGADAAQVWSSALGKPVSYAGNDLTQWAKTQLDYQMPASSVFDLQQMYQAWQTDGLIATPAETSRLEALLGRKLRTYKDFVSDLSETWR